MGGLVTKKTTDAALSPVRGASRWVYSGVEKCHAGKCFGYLWESRLSQG